MRKVTQWVTPRTRKEGDCIVYLQHSTDEPVVHDFDDEIEVIVRFPDGTVAWEVIEPLSDGTLIITGFHRGALVEVLLQDLHVPAEWLDGKRFDFATPAGVKVTA